MGGVAAFLGVAVVLAFLEASRNHALFRDPALGWLVVITVAMFAAVIGLAKGRSWAHLMGLGIGIAAASSIVLGLLHSFSSAPVVAALLLLGPGILLCLSGRSMLLLFNP